MTEILKVRQEIHNLIDIMPERNPYALHLLVDSDDLHFVIETDLTEKERTIIAEGEKEYQEHPENFTPWKKVGRG